MANNEAKTTSDAVSLAHDIKERKIPSADTDILTGMTHEPKLEVLIRIADLYGVSLDYLVGRTENR